MYHVLVVDDEPLMRTYLSRCIPKFCSDFDVPAVSGDGIDAVRKLGELNFDVLITDIKMPGMDGLELTQYCRKHYPNMAVVIISGYTDFEYARKAIQYQVMDYLVKPLIDSQLIAVLGEISSRLSDSCGNSNFTRVFCPDNPAKGSMIQTILDKNTERIKAMIDDRQIQSDLVKRYYCLINSTRVQTIEKSSEFYQYQLFSKICELAKNDRMIPLFTKDQNSLVYLEGSSAKNIQDQAMDISAKLVSAFGENALSVVVSEPIDDVLLLPASYEEILKDNSLTVISDKGVYFEWQEMLLRAKYQHLQTCSNHIIEAYRDGAPDQVKVHLDILFDSIPISMNRFVFIQLMKFLCNGANVSTPYQYFAIHKDEINNNTFRALFSEAFIQTRERKKIGSSAPLIQQAVEFIKLHYQENISLSDVARECNVTSSYLSDLFHKEMNLPYSKFLTSLRMEQAKLLLETYDSIRIYDVAQKVGFSSSKHFIKVFKQYFGISPALYQKYHESRK